MGKRSNGRVGNPEPFPEAWSDAETRLEWIQNDIATWEEAGYSVAEYAEEHGMDCSWVYQMRRGEHPPGARTMRAMGVDVEFEKFARAVGRRRR